MYSFLELVILGFVCSVPVGFALATFIGAVSTAYNLKDPEVSVVSYDFRKQAQARHSANVIKGRVFR